MIQGSSHQTPTKESEKNRRCLQDCENCTAMKQSVALVGVQTGIDVVLREDILTNLKKTKVCICDDDEMFSNSSAGRLNCYHKIPNFT